MIIMLNIISMERKYTILGHSCKYFGRLNYNNIYKDSYSRNANLLLYEFYSIILFLMIIVHFELNFACLNLFNKNSKYLFLN